MSPIRDGELEVPTSYAASDSLLVLLTGLLKKKPRHRLRIKDLRRDAFVTNKGAEPLDEPLPVTNAKDGNVAVPKSELAGAIKRIKLLNSGGDAGKQEGVDYSLDYELMAKQVEDGKPEEVPMENLVECRAEAPAPDAVEATGDES